MRAVSTVKVVIAVAAVVLLAGCASVPSVPDEQTLRLNALLDEISGGYSEVSRCLSTRQYRSVDIIDERHLLFRSGTNKAWLNKLRNPCTGLRRNDTLLFDLHGTDACMSDRVSVIDTFVVWRRTGPTCTLGEFKSIPPSYAERIDELLRSD